MAGAGGIFSFSLSWPTLRRFSPLSCLTSRVSGHGVTLAAWVIGATEGYFQRISADTLGAMPLTYDPKKALRHVRRRDPALARVIDAVGPFELEPRGGAFKSLARAIFFQQLAGPAARAIMGRVLAALETDEERWYEPAPIKSR